MKETGVLFKAEMVLAMLAGTKTQTRRPIKDTGLYAVDAQIHGAEVATRERAALAAQAPYGKAGDRIYVKENYRLRKWPVGCTPGKATDLDTIAPSQFTDSTRWFEADGRAPAEFGKLRPSIFMMKCFARIWLELEQIRVERLHDISEDDAKAEGWQIQADRSTDPEVHADAARDWYADLWVSINGAANWAANPFVYVYTFKRINRP